MLNNLFICSLVVSFAVTLLLASCTSQTVPENNKVGSSLSKNGYRAEQQTALGQFNFNQPFTMEVRALGCGIGCPIYRMTLNPDFTAQYQGIAFVKRKGQQDFLLSPQQKHTIRELLTGQKFKAIQAPVKNCHHRNTSEVRYQVTLKQQTKHFNRVVSEGCHRNAVLALEQTLDQLVGRWKGKFNRKVK